MPHRGAAWALLEERLRDAATFCSLAQEIGPATVADELAAVHQALDDVADSLAVRFPDWGPEAAFSSVRRTKRPPRAARRTRDWLDGPRRSPAPPPPPRRGPGTRNA